MVRAVWATAALGLMLAVSPVRAADEKATTKDKAPAAKSTESKSAEATPARRASSRGGRLTKPWSMIESLSDEQKEKIVAIHRKSLDEVNAIEAKEKSDIMALLSETQKSELKASQDREAADRKAARARTSASKTDAPAAAEAPAGRAKSTK